MKHAFPLVAVALCLCACAPPSPQNAAPPEPAPVVSDAPAGEYTLDHSHASLSFRVSHLGFSMYTARFSSFDATLQFDPANATAMRVEASIDPRSLTLPAPPAGFLDELLGAHWFDATQFPQMTFRSTSVEQTGPNTARVIGDLTLHGVTHPVTFDATFNGGYTGNQFDPHARIGFSAHGTLKRSDFGIAVGIPAPGSNMGVGDEVEFAIEAELSGPAWTGAAEQAP